MNSNLKRIAITFSISIVGLISTYYYFLTQYPILKFHFEDKPIAKVEALENISRKKLAEHRTWQVIEYGDNFYTGETIKTSSDSDLSIRFLETNSILNLEPDSLITIQKNQDEISLNLIEGHLFVDSSKNESDKSIKLESSDGLIDLKNVTASLTKNKNSNLNVDIVNGQALVQSKDGTTKSYNQTATSLTIINPTQLSVIESLKPEVNIKWNSIENTNPEDFIFKVGSKRSDYVIVKPISIKNNEALIPVKFGKNFIQIEIIKPNSIQVLKQSSVRFELKPQIDQLVKAEVVLPKPILTPEVFWFQEGEENQNYVDKPEIDLKWNVKNKETVKNLIVKIYQNEKIIFNEKISVEQNTFKAKVSRPGRYLASIEAVDENTNAIAKTNLKSIVSAELPYLPSPVWKTNSESKADLSGTYIAKWSALKDVETYKLVLKNPDGLIIKNWTQKNTFVKLGGLLPGQYTLVLTTIDHYKRISPNDAVKMIQVSDSSEISAPKLKKMRFK